MANGPSVASPPSSSVPLTVLVESASDPRRVPELVLECDVDEAAFVELVLE